MSDRDEKMAVWMLFTLQEFSAAEIDTPIKALQVKLSEPYTETWTDGYDDADEMGAEWRRQMDKD